MRHSQELLKKTYYNVSAKYERMVAYELLKKDCSKQPTLLFYDVSKPVKISADSSKSGLEAIYEQDGHPVAYASRALSDTQIRYAQIEKELLAIVFACEKFHQFIYGKSVTVETDHKPLVSIFKKSLNDYPMRFQRMLLRLQHYDLQVVYKKGNELYVADSLSRAYREIRADDSLEESLEIHMVLPISAPKLKELQEETRNNPVMKNYDILSLMAGQNASRICLNRFRAIGTTEKS